MLVLGSVYQNLNINSRMIDHGMTGGSREILA